MANFQFFPYHATTNGDLVDGDLDSAPTAASGFAKNNLLDRSRNPAWKANANSSAHTFLFDLNSAVRTIDYCILCGTDAKTVIASPKLKVEHDDNSGFASATVVVNSVDIDTEPHFLKEFTAPATTERYWRIKIEDGSSSGKPVLGSIYLGERIDASFFYDTGDAIGQEYNNVLRRSPTGKISSDIISKPRNVWNIQWRFMSEAFRTNLQTIFLRTYGSHYPLFIKDDKGTLRFVRLFLADGKFTPIRSFHQIYEFGLTIREEDEINFADGDGITAR